MALLARLWSVRVRSPQGNGQGRRIESKNPRPGQRSELGRAGVGVGSTRTKSRGLEITKRRSSFV